MTKSAITKTWIAGLIVFAAGIVAAMIGVILMMGYGGTLEQIPGTDQYDFTPTVNGFFWTAVTVITAGGLMAAIGGIVQLAAWIAALVNSYLLPEKTWFVILLLGGVLGLAFGLVGFAAMVAFVIAAPDGTPYRQPQVPAPKTLAPTT